MSGAEREFDRMLLRNFDSVLGIFSSNLAGEGFRHLNILSIGCGRATEVLSLKDRFPKFQYVGVDLESFSDWRTLHSSETQKVHFLAVDASRLELLQAMLLSKCGFYAADLVIMRHPETMAKTRDFDKIIVHALPFVLAESGSLIVTTYFRRELEAFEEFSGLIFGKKIKSEHDLTLSLFSLLPRAVSKAGLALVGKADESPEKYASYSQDGHTFTGTDYDRRRTFRALAKKRGVASVFATPEQPYGPYYDTFAMPSP